MTQPYRLLAVDVDGTLMNTRNELPRANAEALHRAHEAGITVCLCTGRSFTETRDVIRQLGFDSDVGVFAFGSIVSELPAGRTFARTPLPPDLVQRLIDHFGRRGYPVLVLYDADQTGGLDYHLVRGERLAAAYDQFFRLTPARWEHIDAWDGGRGDVVRLGIIDDPEHIHDTVSELARAFPPNEMKFNPIYAPNYRLHVVECFAPVVNKWYGIGQVAARLGISREQIVTIGDDVNDIEMIREAGLGVAMGNAVDKVKAVARWQAPTNNENGVAALVDALLEGRQLHVLREAS